MPTSHFHLLRALSAAAAQSGRRAAVRIQLPSYTPPFARAIWGKSKPGWKGRCQGGGTDRKDWRREEDSRHRG